ncbi:MAG: 3-deoxy-D-manno-octulosonic acid transferase [Candidatus Omnitrophica bacterium]|nr:3-deoxy-D-manno-octulosonic acid transferase [Candidatus Omnitrophota bacterium]
MTLVYDIIAVGILIGYLPFYLLKRKFHAGFLQRFGFLPKGVAFNRPIWIHAVSLGEIMAAKPLIAALRRAFPHKQLVISTVTPTGNKIAQGLKREGDVVIYLPIDLSWIVRSVLQKINPSLFVIVETELWPNLITSLKRLGVPCVVVNARISDASLRGYASILWFIKPVLDSVSLFCVQSEQAAKRLLHLGVNETNMHVTGNMKFDIALTANKDHEASSQLTLQRAHKDKLWVCGSTHPGEESMLLDIYKQLLDRQIALTLLLAPRHPERVGEICRTVEQAGFMPLCISTLNSSREPSGQASLARVVYILDTVGELISYYRLADLVFVGGSLIKKGGHNIIEPAALGKPIVVGPYMFNFRDITNLFLKSHSLMQVKDTQGLLSVMVAWLENPSEAERYASNALSLLKQNQGASQKNLQFLSKFIQ